MSIKRFHHSDFSNTANLAALKHDTSTKISVCIPTLNEAETIGQIVRIIRQELMEQIPLVDEILVIDSQSTDRTLAEASSAGARAILSSDISPESGSYTGKGENLWKALHVATGDIICYVDGDIKNFHAGYISGLVGPLLEDAEIHYVKAFYERPLADERGGSQPGGGRVSEILIRPLLSLFYPELTGIFQPLAGEYAARRKLLESLAFPTGYGVEIAHLIDLWKHGHLSGLAQTDLIKRVHRNRDDSELGVMSFAILRVFLQRLERDGRISLHSELPELFRSWIFEPGQTTEVLNRIVEEERPPLRDIRAVTPAP
ncbi:glucosyl-3-phosphoglycerate synthase [Luteolibacter pohnpeiensis]|uniref:Glucosyl-3-phosphoglycerate synthase n=1 Tax=Luteolibacter pohnpeiensis TaxID=454153 RepID=A0A934VVR1_9BACT|nr:glucosyl-3-phosphoglycerate synthase [Luteolibacter pohnpeiensis]MBK1881764.1 glucosyl-3-phosphoglycerate synthase [Luteolibacter pohnpeiensis]